VLADAAGARHLLRRAARQVDRLRAGVIRFLAPCTARAHNEQLSPIHAPRAA